MPTTRPCPYCAEEISDEAVLCRYCRSRLTSGDPRRWHRSHPSRRLAGVTSGVAQALALPLSLVRAAFVLGLLFHLSGLFAYLALWLLMPLDPGGVPPYRKAMAWVARQLLRLLGQGGTSSQPGGVPGPRRDGDPASLDVLP